MIYKVICLIFLTLIPWAAICQDYDSVILKHIDKFPESCEIIVGVINGKEEYKFGFTKRGRLVKKADHTNTLFEIGSLTKTFTAALLMREVENGRMSLFDPVQDYLDFRIRQDTLEGQRLRIVHLAMHTSGLKSRPFMSYSRYARYLKRFTPEYPPGTSWQYNNLAVALMGHIVLDLNDATWNKLLHEKLLSPLGMKNTYSTAAEAPGKNRVQCIDKRGASNDCRFEVNDPFIWPSGAVVSTLNDMMVWLRSNIYADRLPSGLSFVEMTHQVPVDSMANPFFESATQGIIWWHVQDGTNSYLAHGGTTPDHTSILIFDPEKKKGVFVYTNSTWPELRNDNGELTTNLLALSLMRHLE